MASTCMVNFDQVETTATTKRKYFIVAGGSTQDFYHASGVMFSATVELRDKGGDNFELPEDEIIPVGEEIWAAMEVVAITAANPDDF